VIVPASSARHTDLTIAPLLAVLSIHWSMV
jgi:hypothetical protein